MHITILILIAILANLLATLSETGIERISFSSKGIECASPCSTEGHKYFWCNLVTKGWDYCSTSPLLDYKGNKCESKCGHHGKSYQWCWIKNGDWGYCSKDSEEVHVTHFGATDEKQCTSTCAKHGYKYYWCTVGKSDWDYCSPKKGRNSGGTKCKTPCTKKDAKYSWCNDEKYKWQYCSEVKIVTSTEDCLPITTIPTNSSAVSSKRCKDQHFAPNGNRNKITDEACLHRYFKRSPHTQKDLKRSISLRSFAHLQKEHLCEKLALNVLSKNPRLEEFKSAPSEENPTVAVMYSGVNERKIPHIIHSSIFQGHRNCKLTKFDKKDEFNKRMIFMNANLKDEKSHIVAPSMCGPSLWYNLFPSQNARSVNGGLKWDSKWELLSEKLEQNPCSFLDAWVILKYHEGSKRPQHLTLCYAFKDVATDRVTFGPESETFEN